MLIKLTIAYQAQGFNNKTANEALGHALRAALIEQKFGLTEGDEPIQSLYLSQLFGNRICILSGPNSYGGAIKGDAILGFLEYYASERWNELYNLKHKLETGDEEARNKLNTARAGFLIGHGIEPPHSDRFLDQVDEAHVAVWETFGDSALVTPTSGSFGLAAYETLKKLRDCKISYILDDDKKIEVSFFRKENEVCKGSAAEGRVSAWMPAATLSIMTLDKSRVVDELAVALGNPPQNWHLRELRDHLALYESLIEGWFFCPTNPKSAEELGSLLKELITNDPISLSKNGSKRPKDNKDHKKLLEQLGDTNSNAWKTLKSLGIEGTIDNENINLVLTRGVCGGRYGLMVPHLRQLDTILREDFGDVKQLETLNQPSIGATLAATADVNRIFMAVAKGDIELTDTNRNLLTSVFPELAKNLYRFKELKLSVTATPDIANLSLVEQLGLTDLQKTPRYSGKPENGLGTITPGLDSAAVLKQCMGNDGTLNDNYYPAPKPFIDIARALLFVAETEVRGDRARYPEPAGAASLAGLLYSRRQEISPPRVALYLRETGVTLEIFENMQLDRKPSPDAQNLDYFIQESKKHGNSINNYAQAFLRAMGQPLHSLREEVSNKIPRGVLNFENVTTIFSTGNNGTEDIARLVIDDIMTNRSLMLFAHNTIINDGQITNPIKVVAVEAPRLKILTIRGKELHKILKHDLGIDDEGIRQNIILAWASQQGEPQGGLPSKLLPQTKKAV